VKAATGENNKNEEERKLLFQGRPVRNKSGPVKS
jgi:hypothetical protein